MPKLMYIPFRTTDELGKSLSHKEFSLQYKSSAIKENKEDHIFNKNHSGINVIGIDISLSFPQQLMKMMFRKEFEDIISWVPDGKAFIILDKEKLIAGFSSLYYQYTKYESFIRKLHRWGFKFIKKGSDVGAYYHKFFLRDDPSLCSNISCVKKKKKTDCEMKAKKVSKVEENDHNHVRNSEIQLIFDLNRQSSLQHRFLKNRFLLNMRSLTNNLQTKEFFSFQSTINKA